MILKKKISQDLKIIYTFYIIFLIFAFTDSYFFTTNLKIKLIGLLIFVIGSIPIFNHYLNKKKNIVPLFHLHMLFYALIFGASSFVSQNFLYKFYSELYHIEGLFFLDDDLFLRNIIFILIAIILLFLGYLFINLFKLDNYYFDLNFLKKISNQKILYLSLIFFLFQITYLLFEELQNISTIKRVNECFAYFTICSFYFLIINSNKRLILKILLTLFITIIIVANLYSTNALMFTINIFLMMCIIFYFYKRKFPWLVLFLLFVVIYFNSFKHVIRAYHNNKKLLNTSSDYSLLVKTLKKEDNFLNPSSGIIRSLNSYFIFHFALSEVPKSFPYFQENSFRSLFYFYIPRIFWTNKPENMLGQKFGREYGFVTGNSTSINFPWIAELYLNFSLLGLFFGMFIFGCIMNFLTRLISVSKKNYTQILLGISTAGTLIVPEVSFASMIAYSLQNFFFLLVVFFIYSKITK